MSRSAYDRLRLEGGCAPYGSWSLITVRGSHRERFLHSQLTSDVAGLEVGGSQPSAQLDGSGRLVAQLWLHKLSDRVHLLAPEAVGATCAGALDRHLVADDVQLEVRPPASVWLGLGPEAALAVAELPADDGMPVEMLGEPGLMTWGDRPKLPDLAPDLLDGLHVVTGWPRWGREIEAGMLVTETMLMELAVSLSKGCFLGQETVAKIQSRRGAAYHPVALELADGDRAPEALVGRTLRAQGRRAGTVRAGGRWGGKPVLQVAMFRDLRVEGLELDFELDGGEVIAGRVRLLPAIELQSAAARAEELHEHASRLFAADRDDEAVRVLERAIAVCPAEPDAYESLGVIFGRRKDYDRAIALMHRLLEVDPLSVMAHSNLSLYYNHLGRIEDAEREMELAARAALERRRREHEEAATAQHRERAGRAERERRQQMFEQVLGIDPDDPLAHFGLGELRLEDERFSEAVEHLERAMAADPAMSAAYLALGRALEGLAEASRARDVYRRGVDVAARRGDLMTANRMKERLAALADRP